MQLLSNPGQLIKIMSAYILTISITGALVVAGIDLVRGAAIPNEVTALIGMALGQAAYALGLNHGTQMINSSDAAKLKSQYAASLALPPVPAATPPDISQQTTQQIPSVRP